MRAQSSRKTHQTRPLPSRKGKKKLVQRQRPETCSTSPPVWRNSSVRLHSSDQSRLKATAAVARIRYDSRLARSRGAPTSPPGSRHQVANGPVHGTCDGRRGRAFRRNCRRRLSESPGVNDFPWRRHECAHRLRHLRGARAGLSRLRRDGPSRPAPGARASARTSSGRSTCWPARGWCRRCAWSRRATVPTSRAPEAEL